ncbi:uncharacterized protein LOC126895009 [Daktulosphaira vitifoliae]|uniref:uncharacterized protein LOC126895009 n=1 Tax=Daktulosphaira vitifoliae TaxID=58002 RepID=UPI0021AAE5C3|nr:uncharacterized protein LOC126895009 [Daktulosphaira vitifoliae]
MDQSIMNCLIILYSCVLLTVNAETTNDQPDLMASPTLWLARQWSNVYSGYPGSQYPPYYQQPHPYQPPNPNYSGWGPNRPPLPPPPPGYLPNSNPNPQIDYSNYAVHGGHGFGNYGIN